MTMRRRFVSLFLALCLTLTLLPAPALAASAVGGGSSGGGTEQDEKEAACVAAGGHYWDAGVTTIPEWCPCESYITYTCTNCGAKKNEDLTPSHVWDAGVVTTPPTTTAVGVRTYTCTRCGETKTEDIPMLPPVPSVPVQRSSFLKTVPAIPDVTGWIAISSYEDLCLIGKDAAHPSNGDYYLTGDIRIPDGAVWTPIMPSYTPFCGTFDGQGHYISNLCFDSTAPSTDGIRAFGLFGNLQTATIRNLGVMDVNIRTSGVQGNFYIGAIAGKAGDSVFENCCSSGEMQDVGDGTSLPMYGGIIGGAIGDSRLHNRISDCRSDVGISIRKTAEDTDSLLGCAGGMAGCAEYSDFENCVYGRGQTATEPDGLYAANAGGIAGTCSYATFTGCENDKPVTGTEYAGGIAGRCASSEFTSCENTGTITGSEYAGGIAGSGSRTFTSCKNNGAINCVKGTGGGILGEADNVDMRQCVNNGDVKSLPGDNHGFGPSGGIIGAIRSANASIADCENNGDVYIYEHYQGFDFSSYFDFQTIAGGIVGSLNYRFTAFSGCVNTGNIHVYSDGHDKYDRSNISVGGIVGTIPYIFVESENATISKCTNSGAVYGEAYTASGSVRTGGIMGWNNMGVVISHCENTGSVASVSTYDESVYKSLNYAHDYPLSCCSGGICGFADNASTISYCSSRAAGSARCSHDCGYNTDRHAVSSLLSGGTPTLEGCATTTATFMDHGSYDISFLWYPSFLVTTDSTVYDNNIAIASLILSAAAEQSDGSAQVLTDMQQLGLVPQGTTAASDAYFSAGYEDNDDKVGHSFGLTKIKVDGTEYNLITIVAKGTTNNNDIKIDITAGAFEKNATDITNEVGEFITKNGLSLLDPNNRFLVVGHSLGGATANLVAQDLIHDDGCLKTNIYGYTFASPLTAWDTDLLAHVNNNIFNTVNKRDFVPCISPYQTFGALLGLGCTLSPAALIAAAAALTATGVAMTRYGCDLLWDSSTQSFLDTYKTVFGKEWPADPVKGPDVLDYHYTATYMAHLLDGIHTKVQETGQRRLIIIACPVDVEVLNAAGKVMASTSGSTVSASTDPNVTLMISGDRKFVYITGDGAYSLRYTATGTGSMIVTVQDVKQNAAGDDVTQAKTFQNIALTPGKTFTSNIESAANTSDVRVLVTDNAGAAEKEEQQDGTEMAPVDFIFEKPALANGLVTASLRNRTGKSAEVTVWAAVYAADGRFLGARSAGETLDAYGSRSLCFDFSGTPAADHARLFLTGSGAYVPLCISAEAGS